LYSSLVYHNIVMASETIPNYVSSFLVLITDGILTARANMFRFSSSLLLVIISDVACVIVMAF
jgi:hypothetical protein